jgi:hypothetical protein
MHPYIAAAIGRERSAMPAFVRSTALLVFANRETAVHRRPDARRWAARREVLDDVRPRSIAQGAPFVLVAAELERRGVGTGWLAAVAAPDWRHTCCAHRLRVHSPGRYATRTVFAVTGLARGALIAALWIALRMGSPEMVLVTLLFVLVAVGTPTFPALMRAVRDRAQHARLDRTSALAAGLESAAFVAGPALGGLLLLITPRTRCSHARR